MAGPDRLGGRPRPAVKEAHFLSLDSTKARQELGWAPPWDLDAALRRIVEWYLGLRDGADMRALTAAQVEAFQAGA